MSSTKKRKNDTSSQAHDGTHPEESSLRQTVYIIQSTSRPDWASAETLKTHAIFSTLNDANEAARRIFNEMGPDYGPVTKADLAAANAARLEKGQRVWDVIHESLDSGDVDCPKEIRFQASGAVLIVLGRDVGDGEELRVWVETFGVDKGMPIEIDE